MNRHAYDKADENLKIISAIQRIHNILKKTPTQKDYKIHRTQDELSLEQILYRFGRYSEAVKAAGLKPNDFQIPPRHPEITKSELIEEFVRIAKIESKIPSKEFFRANSKYSWTPYKTKWGSWKEAVYFITTNFQDKLGNISTRSRSNASNKKRTKLKIECPLVFEPKNEIETIVLFGLLAKDLGYKILKIQSDFPDGLLEKDGQEIPVEFEFLSSNYLQHGHSRGFQGLCICWRKDSDLGNITTLSLEEYIRNLI
jgi:hypothetical protein